jgi:hypothetical protein
MVDMDTETPTAAAAATDDDPSFDLIERHRVVWAAFVDNPSDEALAAVRDLFFEIVDTVPTTPAGHFDKWHYIIIEAAEWGFSKIGGISTALANS